MKKESRKKGQVIFLVFTLILVFSLPAIKTASGSGEGIQFKQVNVLDDLNWHIRSLAQGREESMGGNKVRSFEGLNSMKVYLLCDADTEFEEDFANANKKRAFCMEPSVLLRDKDSYTFYPYRLNTEEVIPLLKSHYGISDDSLIKMARAVNFFDYYRFPLSFGQAAVWLYMGDVQEKVNLLEVSSADQSLDDLREQAFAVIEEDGESYNGNKILYECLAEAELMAMRMENFATEHEIEVDEAGEYSFGPIPAYAVPGMWAEAEEGSPIKLDEGLATAMSRMDPMLDKGDYELKFQLEEDAPRGVYSINVYRPDYAGDYQWKCYSSHKNPSDPVEKSCQLFGQPIGDMGLITETFKLKVGMDEEGEGPQEDEDSNACDDPAKKESDNDKIWKNKNNSNYISNINIHYPDREDSFSYQLDYENISNQEKEQALDFIEKDEIDDEEKDQEDLLKEDLDKEEGEDLEFILHNDEKDFGGDHSGGNVKDGKKPLESQQPEINKKKTRIQAEDLTQRRAIAAFDNPKEQKKSTGSTNNPNKKGTFKDGDRLFSPETGFIDLTSLPFFGGTLIAAGSGLLCVKKVKEKRKAEKRSRRRKRKRR